MNSYLTDGNRLKSVSGSELIWEYGAEGIIISIKHSSDMKFIAIETDKHIRVINSEDGKEVVVSKHPKKHIVEEDLKTIVESYAETGEWPFQAFPINLLDGNYRLKYKVIRFDGSHDVDCEDLNGKEIWSIRFCCRSTRYNLGDNGKTLHIHSSYQEHKYLGDPEIEDYYIDLINGTYTAKYN